MTKIAVRAAILLCACVGMMPGALGQAGGQFEGGGIYLQGSVVAVEAGPGV